MSPNAGRTKRTWSAKFRDAFRGLREGIWGQHSFFVHFSFAAMVIAAAAVLRVDDRTEWCLLLLCIAGVLTAEMFNSALESLAKAITDELDPHVGRALNIGSAAVLIASLGAAVVGAVIFLTRLATMLGWW